MVVFLDTGFLLALRNVDDINHSKAINAFKNEILKGKYGKIIVTDYVFNEIMTLIMVRIKNVEFAKKTSSFIINSPRVNLLFITEEIFKWSTGSFLCWPKNGLPFIWSGISPPARLINVGPKSVKSISSSVTKPPVPQGDKCLYISGNQMTNGTRCP